MRLVPLEPATSVPEGEILRAWVSIDQDPRQRIYGGAIIADSETGNHSHAFAFFPRRGGERAALLRSEPDDEATEPIIVVWVNPVFRETYCTDASQMTVEVVEQTSSAGY